MSRFRYIPSQKKRIYDEEYAVISGIVINIISGIKLKKPVVITLFILMTVFLLVNYGVVCFSYNLFADGRYIGKIYDYGKIEKIRGEYGISAYPAISLGVKETPEEIIRENIMLCNENLEKCFALKINGEIIFTASDSQIILAAINQYGKKYKTPETTRLYLEGDVKIEMGIYEKSYRSGIKDGAMKLSGISVFCEETKIKETALMPSVLKTPDESIRGEEQVVLKKGIPGTNSVIIKKVFKNGEQISEETEEKVIKEAEDTVVAVSAFGFFSGEFSMPVMAEVSSGFGERWGKEHKGIDFAANEGDRVSAAEGGIVTFSGFEESFGNFIIIDHGNGIESYYAHMSKLEVEKGEKVYKGQKIGEVGNTGNSMGPHLHFEIRKDKIAQNPADFIAF